MGMGLVPIMGHGEVFGSPVRREAAGEFGAEE